MTVFAFGYLMINMLTDTYDNEMIDIRNTDFLK